MEFLPTKWAALTGTKNTIRKQKRGKKLENARFVDLKSLANFAIAAIDSKLKLIIITAMTKRLEILKNSLKKKEKRLDEKFETHFETVRQANGQPLNDKRNGQATLNKWERQSNSIRTLQESIEKTKRAIEIEEGKITDVEHVNTFIPDEILKLVEAGELKQWRKHPHIFFVDGVDKARIVWDKKRKVVVHKYAHLAANQQQYSKFVKVYNGLHSIFNKP